MPVPAIDFLIIGQGLAGSILAYSLIKRGKRILVLDNQHQHSSSLVAAGIINPITGQRLKISEGFEYYFPVAEKTYRQMENHLDTSFFSNLEQRRLLKDQQQLDYYLQCLQQDKYRPYLDSQYATSPEFADTAMGDIGIFGSTLVNTRALLAKTRGWLRDVGSYQAGKLDYAAIEIGENGYTLGSLRAKNIVFCEGFQAIYNPWLKNLPFKLSKGEILTVEHQPQNTARMLNWGNWLVPTSQPGVARLGANYVWDDLSLVSAPETEQNLLSSLHQFTTIHASSIRAEVGIRPTTLRRQPFVGPLSALGNAYCFNGFGSKGCLVIPYYAELFCDYLSRQKPLPDELTRWL